MSTRPGRSGTSQYVRRDPGAATKRDPTAVGGARAKTRIETSTPRALVCTDDAQIRKCVAMAGFDVTVAASADVALPLLRHERWECVALERLPDREIGHFLATLFGERRRELFVMKVDGHFITGDRFQAWSESADLVVHNYDLANLPTILEEAHQDKLDFYKNYRQAQRDTPSRLGGHS